VLFCSPIAPFGIFAPLPLQIAPKVAIPPTLRNTLESKPSLDLFRSKCTYAKVIWFTQYGLLNHWVHCKSISYPPHQISVSPLLDVISWLVNFEKELRTFGHYSSFCKVVVTSNQGQLLIKSWPSSLNFAGIALWRWDSRGNLRHNDCAVECSSIAL